MFFLIQQYCTSAWHGWLGKKSGEKEGEEKGSEQKHCVVLWDRVATWKMSAQLSPPDPRKLFNLQWNGITYVEHVPWWTHIPSPCSGLHFPAGGKSIPFYFTRGLSVSGNLSLIPPLPAALAVQPAEQADVQIQPGMQSCPEGIFKAVCSKVVAVRQAGISASFLVIWQAGPPPGAYTLRPGAVGGPAAPSPALICQDITRAAYDAEGRNFQQTPASRRLAASTARRWSSKAFAGLMLATQQSGKFA